MPSPDAILAGLTEAANRWRWLAVVWHVLLAATTIAALTGRQLSNRVLALVAVALIASVSVVSWVTGNPFNGIVFGGLAIVLFVSALRLYPASLRLEAPLRVIPGAALVLFGAAYPHFLKTDSWIEYAYAAPLGLIPCPTLAVVIGFMLLFRNVGTTAWTVSLIVAGLLYGIVGVFVLGVGLDVVLLAGALALGACALAHGLAGAVTLCPRRAPAHPRRTIPDPPRGRSRD